MKYVLLTRFAMRFEEGSGKRRFERQPDWLEYRFRLFNKYCLPSVRAQTFKDFEWVFFVDPSFPGWTKKMERDLPGRVINVDFPWREGQPEISDLLSYSGQLTTVRLDSDDIIRNDFMERLAAGPKRGWITFHDGFMMRGEKAWPRHYPTNPFQCFAEDADRPLTVMHKTHIHARNVYDLGNGDPGWIQVDHGRNVKNCVQEKRLIDKPFVPASTLRRDFTWI